MDKAADGTDGPNPVPQDSSGLASESNPSETVPDAVDAVTMTMPLVNQVLSQALWQPDPKSKIQQAYAEWLDLVQWNRSFGISPGEVPGFKSFLLENFESAELHALYVEAEETMAQWQSEAVSKPA